MPGSKPGRKKTLYNGCRQVEGTVSQFIDDLELEVVALPKCDYWNEIIERTSYIPPCDL
jgi:hypothetical protein